MPKISVIVPVYNVERYLRTCLDSILKQTLSDIEVICINDGSTDSSREILEEYGKKDCRIKIIDKPNGGLSSARNAGLKHAKGEFISFIDSDDWIENTMLEKLYENAVRLNTDIVICGVHRYDETNKTLLDDDSYFNLKFFDKNFDNRVFSYEDTKSFMMDVCVMAWNKLYRRSFLASVKAEFPEGLIFEDGPFFFSVYFKTKRVSLIRDLLYFYRINREGSIVQKGGKPFLDIIDVVELMYNSIKDVPCFNEIKNEFWIRKADDIFYRYDLVNLFLKRQFAKKLRTKEFLFNPNIFDFDIIKKKEFYIYKHLFEIRDKSSLFNYYKSKIKVFIMFKIMQVLYTESNVYYFKYRKLVIRIKRRDHIYNIWYADDKIYIKFYNKIIIPIKFEYSKIEPKK